MNLTPVKALNLGVTGVQRLIFFLEGGEAACDCEIEKGVMFCHTIPENAAQKVRDPLQDKRFRQFGQNVHKRHIFTPFWRRAFARQGRRNLDRKEKLEKNKRFFTLRLLIFGRGLNAYSTPLLIYPRVEPQSSDCHRRAGGLRQSPGLEFLSAPGAPAAKTGYPRT